MSVMKKLSLEHPKAHSLMKELSFCVFDLETTGGNHDYDKIIEIGLVKIKGLEIVDSTDYLINPEIEIPAFIQKLTAITSLDVEGCPVIEEVIDDILEFMEDSILVAHNTSFDVPFFNSVLKRLGKKMLDNKAICTNLMTKHLMPNLLNSNLHYMSNIFNIEHRKSHRALNDAMATAKLLLKYLEIFISKDISRVNQLYYPRNRYQLDCAHYTDKNEADAILAKIHSLKCPALVTIKGAQGKILFTFPCFKKEKGKAIIKTKIMEEDWTRISLVLYGSLLEVLIHLGEVFSKIKKDVREEIISSLEEICFSGKSPGEKVRFAEDFVVAHHLVPEQMIILPVGNFNHRYRLVFRYPGHEKKLLHYIKKHRDGRANLGFSDPMLKDFVLRYLAQAKARKSGELLVFKRRVALGDFKRFQRTLGRYLKNSPNPHHYPHYYV